MTVWLLLEISKRCGTLCHLARMDCEKALKTSYCNSQSSYLDSKYYLHNMKHYCVKFSKISAGYIFYSADL